MSEMKDVAGSNDLKDGMMKSVSFQGQEVLLARVKGDYFAMGNICPHLKGRLSEGTLEGYTVTCPKHGSQFDIRTGENIRWLKGSGLAANIAKIVKPPHPVQGYRTEKKGDRIMIQVQD